MTMRLVILLGVIAIMVPAFFPRPLQFVPRNDQAVPEGCVGDWLTGRLECKHMFPDGTWIIKRGY